MRIQEYKDRNQAQLDEVWAKYDMEKEEAKKAKAKAKRR